MALLLPQISQIVQALITALFTLIGGIVLFLFGEWVRGRRRKRNLRIALTVELDKMLNVAVIDPTERLFPDISRLSTTVYDNNANRIGSLSRDEVNAIVSFYSWLAQTQSDFRIIQEGRDDREEVEERIFQNFKTLRKEWETALEELEERLPNDVVSELTLREHEVEEVVHYEENGSHQKGPV